MFWDNFKQLCDNMGVKPTPVMRSAGISTSSIAKWQNGSSPNCDNVLSIANVLHCSTDVLIRGKEYVTDGEYELDMKEAELVKMYRAIPDTTQDFIYDAIKTAYDKEISRQEAVEKLSV